MVGQINGIRNHKAIIVGVAVIILCQFLFQYFFFYLPAQNRAQYGYDNYVGGFPSDPWAPPPSQPMSPPKTENPFITEFKSFQKIPEDQCIYSSGSRLMSNMPKYEKNPFKDFFNKSYDHKLRYDFDRDYFNVLFWDYAYPSMWTGMGVDPLHLPNYVGKEIHKPKCPVKCKYYGKLTLPATQAHAIMFEPQVHQKIDWQREPVDIPSKFAHQSWISFGYETPQYFPQMGHPAFLRHMDFNVTYEQNSAVPMTFTCDWGGGNLIEQLKAYPDWKNRKAKVALMVTNCGAGGAEGRYSYLFDFIEALPNDFVHSYGGCLHNTELPIGMRNAIYSDHGQSMANKIKVFSEYKYVLAFENNNITDYVTEKIWNAFQSSALPVYMGSPNVEDWLPGDQCVIRTDKFKGPKDLAKYILWLEDHPEEYAKYFEWKRKPLRESFLQKYKHCAFTELDCRFCTEVARRSMKMKPLPSIINHDHSEDFWFDTSHKQAYVEVPHSKSLSPTDALTLCAWIKGESFDDGRIIDKNQAGTVIGYEFDVLERKGVPFLRFCGARKCIMGEKKLQRGQWYHACAVYSLDAKEMRLYVNGFIDNAMEVLMPLETNTHPVRIGHAATGGAQFSGVIDEVTIWNVALSQEAIRWLMYAKPIGSEPGLVAYYPFDTQSAKVVDHTPHNNDGKIVFTDGSRVEVDQVLFQGNTHPLYSLPSVP